MRCTARTSLVIKLRRAFTFYHVFSMSKISSGKSLNVENIGIEPMTSCMPCKRSSQLS